MEENTFKVLAKSSGHHDSVRSSSQSDIRNLWTTATLSQPKVNVEVLNVYKDSELEGSSLGGKPGQWYNQMTGHDSDGVWEEWNERNEEVSFKPEELELQPGSSPGSDSEVDKDSGTKMEISSRTSLNVLKHRPHRAYWVEQQNRLPLPLIELMESEALEILTKALRSYRSGIGKDHFLTKQLQQHIERLKRRQNKRQLPDSSPCPCPVPRNKPNPVPMESEP